MGGLISALAGFIANSSVLRFIALKAVLYTLFVVILPIVLWNLIVEYFTEIINWALAALPTDSYIYDVTGLAGWFAVGLQIPQAVTVLVSAMVVRLISGVVLK